MPTQEPVLLMAKKKPPYFDASIFKEPLFWQYCGDWRCLKACSLVCKAWNDAANSTNAACCGFLQNEARHTRWMPKEAAQRIFLLPSIYFTYYTSKEEADAREQPTIYVYRARPMDRGRKTCLSTKHGSYMYDKDNIDDKASVMVSDVLRFIISLDMLSVPNPEQTIQATGETASKCYAYQTLRRAFFALAYEHYSQTPLRKSGLARRCMYDPCGEQYKIPQGVEVEFLRWVKESHYYNNPTLCYHRFGEARSRFLKYFATKERQRHVLHKMELNAFAYTGRWATTEAILASFKALLWRKRRSECFSKVLPELFPQFAESVIKVVLNALHQDSNLRTLLYHWPRSLRASELMAVPKVDFPSRCLCAPTEEEAEDIFCSHIRHVTIPRLFEQCPGFQVFAEHAKEIPRCILEFKVRPFSRPLLHVQDTPSNPVPNQVRHYWRAQDILPALLSLADPTSRDLAGPPAHTLKWTGLKWNKIRQMKKEERRVLMQNLVRLCVSTLKFSKLYVTAWRKTAVHGLSGGEDYAPGCGESLDHEDTALDLIKRCLWIKHLGYGDESKVDTVGCQMADFLQRLHRMVALCEKHWVAPFPCHVDNPWNKSLKDWKFVVGKHMQSPKSRQQDAVDVVVRNCFANCLKELFSGDSMSMDREMYKRLLSQEILETEKENASLIHRLSSLDTDDDEAGGILGTLHARALEQARERLRLYHKMVDLMSVFTAFGEERHLSLLQRIVLHPDVFECAKSWCDNTLQNLSEFVSSGKLPRFQRSLCAVEYLLYPGTALSDGFIKTNRWMKTKELLAYQEGVVDGIISHHKELGDDWVRDFAENGFFYFFLRSKGTLASLSYGREHVLTCYNNLRENDKHGFLGMTLNLIKLLSSLRHHQHDRLVNALRAANNLYDCYMQHSNVQFDISAAETKLVCSMLFVFPHVNFAMHRVAMIQMFADLQHEQMTAAWHSVATSFARGVDLLKTYISDVTRRLGPSGTDHEWFLALLESPPGTKVVASVDSTMDDFSDIMVATLSTGATAASMDQCCQVEVGIVPLRFFLEKVEHGRGLPRYKLECQLQSLMCSAIYFED